MISIKQVSEEGESLNIIRELFRDYEKELQADLCFQSFETELQDPLKKYAAPHGIILLASYNNDIAGCIALYKIDDAVCEMKRLYVKPAFRKNNIGQALVDALIEHATQQQFKIMKLDTLEKLTPAINLYKRNGFFETNAYYQNPLEGVVYMEKQLANLII
jgi:putative acetyltransferase